MKLVIGLTFLLSLGACSLSSDINSDTPSTIIPELPAENSLIGFWNFADAPNATSVFDSSPMNHSTLLYNMSAANFVDSGQGQQVLSFTSASSSYIESALSLQNEDSFSVSLWFKVDSATSANPQHMFWQGYATGNGWGTGTNPASNTNEFHISMNYFNACATGISVYFGSTDAFNNADCSDRSNAYVADNSTPVNDVWNHVVATVEGASTGTATVKLYVNGQLVGSDSNDETNRSLWNASARFASPGTASRYFDGDLYNIRIYNQAISESEVVALFAEVLP